MGDILSVTRKGAGARITRNTSLLISGQLITAVFVLLAISLLGSSLGPEGYGLYRLALTWAFFAGIILDFGSRQFVIREIARNHERLDELVTLGIALRVFLILPLLLSFGALSHLMYHDWSLTLLIFVACTSMCFRVSTDCFMSFFHGLERMEYTAVIFPLQSALVYAGSILAIKYVGATPLTVCIFELCTTSLILGASFFVLKKKTGFHLGNLNKGKFAAMVRACAPFAGIYILGMVSFRIDTIILSKVIKEEMATNIGFFESIKGLVAYVDRFPMLLAAAVYPVLVRELKHGVERGERLLQSGVKIMLMLSIPMAVGWFLLAQDFARFVYRGEAYDESTVVALILVWVLPLRFVNYILGYTINAIHRENESLVISAICAVVSCVLTAVLASKYGPEGAAVATVITFSVMLLAYVRCVWTNLTHKIISRESLMILPAAGVMGVAVWLVPFENLFARVGVGAVVFAISALVLGVLTKSDLDFVLKRFRRASTG